MIGQLKGRSDTILYSPSMVIRRCEKFDRERMKLKHKDGSQKLHMFCCLCLLSVSVPPCHAFRFPTALL